MSKSQFQVLFNCVVNKVVPPMCRTLWEFLLIFSLGKWVTLLCKIVNSWGAILSTTFKIFRMAVAGLSYGRGVFSITGVSCCGNMWPLAVALQALLLHSTWDFQFPTPPPTGIARRILSHWTTCGSSPSQYSFVAKLGGMCPDLYNPASSVLT